MRKKINLILFLIIILAGIIRISDLDKSPPSLDWDEASLGYNAYSILKTGRDEYRQFLPLFTRSFDDYKSAIPAYLMIPFIEIFGLNQSSVRLVSAISGILAVLLVYLITKKLFKSFLAAIFSSFFFAIAPYSVFYSRALFESNIALTFFLLGLFCYLYKQGSTFRLLIALLFFLLSMYTYHSYKIFIPLYLLLLFLFDKEGIGKSKRTLTLLLAAGFVLMLPMVYGVFTGASIARFSSTSIMKFWPPPIYQVLATNHPLSYIDDFLIHDKYYYFFWELMGRYISYFSPVNLFIKESIEPGLIIPNFAVLQPFEFIFWLVGIRYIFSRFSQFKSLISLILLAPIPAVVTWNWFQTVRVLPLFAGFSIIDGFGVYLLLEYLVKLKFVKKLPNFRMFYSLAIVVVGLWSALYLYDSLRIILPMKYSGNWQAGFKESIPEVAKLQDQYDRIIIDSSQAQPYIFVLFYQVYPPDKYQNEVDYKKLAEFRKYYDFGKYSFRKIYWPEDRNLRKTLFMGDEYSLPEKDIKTQINAKIVLDIKDKHGNIISRIVSLE